MLLSENEQRWLLSYGAEDSLQIDGNPKHLQARGMAGLAKHGGVGSIVNHSSKRQNAKCVDERFTSRTLSWAYNESGSYQNSSLPSGADETIPSGAVILYATRNIYPGEQILTNYERHWAGELDCDLPFLQSRVSCYLARLS